MHKIGLKLWNKNIDYYFDEARKLYQDKVFDYVELYIVPGNIDKIEKWKTLNIPFDIHAPHSANNLNLSRSELFNENLIKYLETKEFADKLNADVIVFHGGIDGDYKETARQLSIFGDKRILIENKPFKPLNHKFDYCVGSKYEEIKYIMDNANCGFCLDIGHAICSANSQKIEPYSYIEKLLTLNPKRIHLSDIHMNVKIDEHLNYGDGELDLYRILKMIPDSIPVTIETLKKSKIDLNDYKNDALFLKRIIYIN